jgi:hypothetical protein
LATPNTVTGTPRDAKRRNSRQKPARLPYSYRLSIAIARAGWLAAPTISERNASIRSSPLRTLFSAPSS